MDPGLLIGGWRLQIDPHRTRLPERVGTLDLFLDQAAVDQRENVEHGSRLQRAAARGRRGILAGRCTASPHRATAFSAAARDWSGRSPRVTLVQTCLRTKTIDYGTAQGAETVSVWPVCAGRQLSRLRHGKPAQGASSALSWRLGGGTLNPPPPCPPRYRLPFSAARSTPISPRSVLATLSTFRSLPKED